MTQILYVAVSKETGKVLSGQNGQYAFAEVGNLRRSVNYKYNWEAKQQGKHPRDLYTVHGFDVMKAITPKSTEPFKVHEIYSTNWNDESHLKIEVNDRELLSCGSLSECPEDASIDRDLCFVYDIAEALESAHKAGLEGRPFEHTSENEEEEE